MIDSTDMLYSKEIADSLRTFIIEGNCVKERAAYRNIDEDEISRRVNNFEDIGIQNGNVISVYCSETIAEKLVGDALASPNYLLTAYEEGLINIYTADKGKYTSEDFDDMSY